MSRDGSGLMRMVTGLAVLAMLVGAAVAEPTPAERMAQQFARDAVVLLESRPLKPEYWRLSRQELQDLELQGVDTTRPVTLKGLEAAVLLAREAVALVPTDPSLWRLQLKVATLAERPELMRQAVDRLVELDPDDQVARLQKANLAIEDAQTAEERLQLYERWLAPGRRDEMGGPVASRLALDCALLHRRMGQEQEFGRWLTEAVTLDPGHRAAAALAAGYFRSRIEDPFGQAELLVNLLLADPGSAAVQTELGNLLLEHGAYNGAERLLTLAAYPRLPGALPPPELVADLAVAQWANGNAEAALKTITERQRRADESLRVSFRRLLRGVDAGDQPREEARTVLMLAYGLSAEEASKLFPDPGGTAARSIDLAKMSARLNPTLATVRAAILDRLGDEDAVSALGSARSSYTMLINRELNRSEAHDPSTVARLRLEQALVLLWLGGNINTVEHLVLGAEESAPLSDAAKERFAGLVAMRRGDAQEAIDRLRPLASGDHFARLGLAMARLQLDEKRQAALDLLAVARHQPGSLVSIWAAERLYELLGQRVPINEEARRLEELTETIPIRLDRAIEDPSLCVGIRIEPTKSVYDAFEPVIVNIEIENNWRYPLSIGVGGPIEPSIVLDVTARVARATERAFLDPIVVDIDRRVSLAPRERLVIPFDLRRHRLGLLLDSVALQGAIMRVGGILNFSARPIQNDMPVLKPGVLGSETKSAPFRIEGIRLERQWIEGAMADVIREEGPSDMRVLAFLSQIAGAGMAARLTTENQALFADAMTALTEAYTRMDPVSRAWVLSVIQPSSTEPILAIARRSEEPIVKMAYMAYCLQGENDPMIDAGRRDEDPRIRLLAEFALESIRSAPSAQ